MSGGSANLHGRRDMAEAVRSQHFAEAPHTFDFKAPVS
jgi:hypothetical protein